MTTPLSFSVTNIVDMGDGMKTVTFTPIFAGNADSTGFFSWTPSGIVTLGPINAQAAQQFALGSQFDVTFTAVPAAVAAA